jgi:CheY-like chemotaxis protein/predicted regulator of Ras-like GTPase activity (Roadblock/LC7/MglB family)
MTSKILVVDQNEAFATMLREMLERDGGYQVEVTDSGSHALELIRQGEFDLTIVDMELDAEDMDYRELIDEVREVRSTMRLMLIPLMGEDLPQEARELDVQGILTKPFFADDLLPKIQQVLAKQVGRPAVQPPPSPVPTPDRPESRSPVQPAGDVQGLLSELVHETNASTVLLLSTEAGSEGVVAHVSAFDDGALDDFSRLTLDAIGAAQAAGHFLGEPDQPFEHSIFEGESDRLYIMALSERLSLVVVTPVGIPLGVIRHNLRRARRELDMSALT